MNDKKINNKIINKIMDNKIKNNTLTNNKLSDNIIKSNKITGKKIKKTIVLFLIISLVISIAYGYRKINLMIGEEIILETNKLYETTLLNSGDKYDFEITINMNNYWLCKAFCDEKIVDITKDINKNNLINDSFYFYNSKSKELSYTIEAPRGYGQSIYQYEIKCQNIPTKKCPANNNSYVRKSTLIINHKPSEEEEVIINQTLLLYDSLL
ncbi:MAG: hypothetical protein KatS3mg002_0704 [Candidatus Woesearchaeota archaeon]|nr:MAG: hypothetical protein KatS3mg002_0704 [Candidatus Woesearchaeota archaeon]